jgi:UDP-glucuronate 4-epimerase
MAYFKFVQAIATGKPIEVYNYGQMQRDFTYINDIVEGVVRVMQQPPQQPLARSENQPAANSQARYKLYNIGNNHPVELMDFIRAIEHAVGKPAHLSLLPMQPGDVPITYADVDDLIRDVGFKPQTSIEAGIERFVCWYQDYYATSPSAQGIYAR